MADYFVEAEKARSGRSTCRGCSQIIQKGQLRIADSFEEDHFQNHPWHHIECFNKLSKRQQQVQVEDIRGYDDLNGEDRKIVRKVIEQIQENMKNVVKAKNKSKRTVSKAKAKTDAQQPESDSEVEQPKKTKKAKKEKKIATTHQGLSSKERKRFEEFYQEFLAKTANQLKNILSISCINRGLNNQPKTGTKNELAERCADGALLGRIPSCDQCGGGKLRFDRDTGEYSCPGYMDDNDFKRCGQRFQRVQIKREQWKSS